MLSVVLHGCKTTSLTLREERTLNVFESRILRRIFGHKLDENGERRRLYNEEIHSLCHSPKIVLSQEPWTVTKRSFRLVWRCHQLLSEFLLKCHLPRVSRESRLSANDKGDEIIPGAVNRFFWEVKDLVKLPYSWDNPRKTSTRRPSDEGCASSHCLKWGPLPSNVVSRIAQHVRKGEWKNGRGIFCVH